MAGLKELAKRVKAINLDSLKDEVINQNETLAVDYNKDQLEAGFDSNNNRLRTYASPIYAAVKNNMNPRPGFDNPDLLYTGDFYEGFKSDKQGNKLVIDSDDSKTDELTAKYGNEIFGLNEQNKQVWDKQNIQDYLRKWLSLSGL